MPLKGKYGPAPITTTGARSPVPTTTDEDEGQGVLPALIGAGVVGAGALALRNPAAARAAGSRLGRLLTGARYTSMLSGLAVPKSILGNVGAATAGAIEQRSFAPLRQFFSPTTVREFGRELVSPTTQPAAYGQATGRWNPFGRIMGAGDTATQAALRRAGITAERAEELALQSPKYVVGPAKEALESPVGKLLVPFRRTGFNQFYGGLQAMKEHPRVAAGYGLAGAALGSNEDIDPRTIGLLSPLASVYTLPFVLGATAARYRVKPGEAGRVVGGASPISEYGIQTLATEPFKPFYRPAAMSALRYLRGE